MIYLDNAATTQPCEQAVTAVCNNMKENFGNASSLHKAGIEAEKVITSCKNTILQRLGAEGEIFFTSGATESNNTALFGLAEAYKRSGNRIISTAMEHPSIAKALDKLESSGYEIVRLSPKDYDDFPAAIASAVDEKTIIVTAMAVNNETGYYTDTARLYNLVKRKNPKCLVHTDAVQAFLKVPVKGDTISLSAHKIHGVKGVGALYVAKGVRFHQLMFGGEQQKGLRPGTEPVDLIAGFDAAIKAFPPMEEYERHCRGLSERLISRLSELSGITINSYGNVPNIMNFSVKGVRSEIMLHCLEEKEIYVSSGSACSKGKKSIVLSAFGVGDGEADTAVRVSFSRFNTAEDIDAFAAGIEGAIKRIRRYK